MLCFGLLISVALLADLVISRHVRTSLIEPDQGHMSQSTASFTCVSVCVCVCAHTYARLPLHMKYLLAEGDDNAASFAGADCVLDIIGY